MKTKSLITLILIGILFLSSSCKDDDENLQLDKQVRIEFGGTFPTNIGVQSTSWQLINDYDYKIINFNKNNYLDIKSVTFSASIYSADASNYCNLELYDLTNEVSIENSQINSNNNYVESEVKWAPYITSPNILNNLPDATIDLGIRIKSSFNFVYSYFNPKMYLILER